MISLPLKWTSNVDFGTPIRDYIKREYKVQDADEYAQDILFIQNLRNEIRHSAYSPTWRDTLYRYILSLDQITPKFTGGSKMEDSLNLAFEWEDTFTSSCVEQKSLAHEKAGVLFNFAAVCSGIACAQDRGTEIGMKTAYNHFQLASNILEHIGSKFMYPAALDLTSESISMLSNLQLAQAQECMFDKAVDSKKAPQLLAKLSSQLQKYYSEVISVMESPSFRSFVKTPWLVLSKIKMKYFGMLSNYYQGLHYESVKSYGLSVGYLNASASQAKSLKKHVTQKKGSDYGLPKDAITIPQNRSASKNKMSDLYVSPSSKEFDKLVSDCKSIIATIEFKATQAEKDNNLVYHQQVPKMEELDEITPLIAVKPIRFQDFFLKIATDFSCGKILFAGLVTESVLNEVSAYIKKRDQIINDALDISRLADSELHNSLEGSGLFSALPGVIDITLNKKKIGECVDVNIKVIKNISTQIKDTRHSVLHGASPLKPKIVSLIENLKLSVAEITRMISEDNSNYSIMKAKYLNEWPQKPLSEYDYNLLQTAESSKSEVETFSEECERALNTITALEDDIELLKDVEKARKYIIEKSLEDADSLDGSAHEKVKHAIFSSSSEEKQSSDNANSIIIRASKYLESLKAIKNSRKCRIEYFKKLQTHDPVKEGLLISTDGCREAVSNALSEYKQGFDEINGGIKEQKKLIKNILAVLNELNSESQVFRTFGSAQKMSDELVNSYVSTFNQWKECVDKLAVNLKHLESLRAAVNDTRSKLSTVCASRESEASVLASRIEHFRNVNSEEEFKSAIDKLSLTIRAHNVTQRPSVYPGPPLPYRNLQQPHSEHPPNNADIYKYPPNDNSYNYTPNNQSAPHQQNFPHALDNSDNNPRNYHDIYHPQRYAYPVPNQSYHPGNCENLNPSNTMPANHTYQNAHPYYPQSYSYPNNDSFPPPTVPPRERRD